MVMAMVIMDMVTAAITADTVVTVDTGIVPRITEVTDRWSLLRRSSYRQRMADTDRDAVMVHTAIRPRTEPELVIPARGLVSTWAGSAR